ncbi:MAG TPA: DUF359 domain-containing protein [Candidatus Thermoplasmatota archaeon]|nr:DUF359 domain-containing protein [Candidatus Thermoplasmatota archaeon]
MYVLPAGLREQLQQPIGHLVDEPGLVRLVSHENYVVSVGDRVTYTLLKHEITPVLCIIDFLLERKSYPEEMRSVLSRFGRIRLRVKNPIGTISDDLWEAIESVYKHLENGPYCIEVDGEEDLASLAAIYLAPGGVTVIYGLPNKGVVVVKATRSYKQKVKQVLDQM